MIVLDEQPFRMVEYQGFRRFCQTSCPQLQLPSRQTIRTDCVKLFLERKQGHILNLVVQYGLEEIGTSIRRVREAVKWLTNSPQRSSQWAKVVSILADRIDSKKALCLDVPTRWNSTYLMLQSAIPYAEAFQLYSQMYPSYKKDLSQKKHDDEFIGLLEEQDWISVTKMIEYLQKFYALTVLMFDTKYPTSHIFFAEMSDIFDLISEMELSDDYEISSMAMKMRVKIGKYWVEDMELNPRINRILYIVVVLDPRQKMNHVETCFKSISRDARGEIMVRDVTHSLNELFDYYVAQREARNPAQHRRDDDDDDESNHEGRSDRRGLCNLVGLRGKRQTNNANELAVCLTENNHIEDKDYVDHFDILKWWSENPRYPILSDMARDILAIPISSVASESAFSLGCRVLTPYRSSLAPCMVEALVCASDWLKSIDVERKCNEDLSEKLANIGLDEFQSAVDITSLYANIGYSVTLQVPVVDRLSLIAIVADAGLMVFDEWFK
ncbi:zinc finger BED domain-containing protein RICESLEEPER 2-like [Salvia divinorum]|uniref:Zinc finger BED domain-containing protein RICESLEEPER 2-like n=1 Tax=Salvia divinorum TaxID=28513 RepID=A0ABD1HJG7_SALDI